MTFTVYDEEAIAIQSLFIQVQEPSCRDLFPPIHKSISEAPMLVLRLWLTEQIKMALPMNPLWLPQADQSDALWPKHRKMFVFSFSVNRKGRDLFDDEDNTQR